MATLPYQPIRVPRGGLLASSVGTPQEPQPPFDPMAYEDDDVVRQMARITGSGSDYMRQAEAQGYAAANRRGLLNSSMAIGAARSSALMAAAPLASQEAAQRASRNQARLTGTLSLNAQREQLGAQERMQGQQLTVQERMAGAEIRSREALAAANIESEERRLGRQLTSQELQQQRDIAARQQLQTEELTSRTDMLQRQLASEEARLGRQLTSQEAQQQRDIVARQQLQTQDIASREGMFTAQIASEEARLGRQLSSAELQQQRELAARQGLLGAELASREALTREGYDNEIIRAQIGEKGATDRANLSAATQIKERELANLSEAQRATLAYYLDSNRIYSSSLDNLYANKEMPAPARDAAIQNFLALRNAGVNLPALTFGTQLNWGGSTSSTTPASPGLPPVPSLAPSVDVAPLPTPSPVAGGPPLVDHGPMAGTIYSNGKFYDPNTGAPVTAGERARAARMREGLLAIQ